MLYGSLPNPFVLEKHNFHVESKDINQCQVAMWQRRQNNDLECEAAESKEALLFHIYGRYVCYVMLVIERQRLGQDKKGEVYY